eukprot:scaffold2165_cov289-Prasinococcus_capsulatus_cf.AAC.5
MGFLAPRSGSSMTKVIQRAPKSAAPCTPGDQAAQQQHHDDDDGGGIRPPPAFRARAPRTATALALAWSEKLSLSTPRRGGAAMLPRSLCSRNIDWKGTASGGEGAKSVLRTATCARARAREQPAHASVGGARGAHALRVVVVVVAGVTRVRSRSPAAGTVHLPWARSGRSRGRAARR